MEKSSVGKVFDDITYNYQKIKENIAQASVASGRTENDVKFMAVTKTVQPVFINHALSLGIGLIGENKVQELLEKKDSLHGNYEAHIIGHLQTNKVRKILPEITMVQSVDSIRLAEEIEKQAAAASRVMDILLEVNIGEEEAKTGMMPAVLTESALKIAAMKHIRIRGLMSVPPVCEDEVRSRHWFSLVRETYERLRENEPLKNMDVLSMGMSADYAYAVREGATLVRIGSALFGQRRY